MGYNGAMPSSSTKSRPDRPEFVFVGEHPAVDFANTVVVSNGDLEDLLSSWSDLVRLAFPDRIVHPPELGYTGFTEHEKP